MGMYTQFIIECQIKENAPDSFKASLQHLIARNESAMNNIPRLTSVFASEMDRSLEGKEFFEDSRFIFLGNPEDESTMMDISTAYCFENQHLRIGTEVKNHNQTIDKFWKWILPWIDEPEGKEIGWMCYEEFDIPSPVIVGQDLNYGSYPDNQDVYML